jgi:hypothetical protein
MALIRVAQYNSTPTVVEDYQAQNAHLQAFTNQLLTQQFILDSGTAQPVIKQGAYVSHGGSLYVADADTSITGSPGDGSVYIRVSGSTSLAVEFVNDISGYVWNPVYTALTSTTYTLLPYLIVKAGTVWTRYNFNPNNQSFGDTRLNSLAVLNNATVGGTLGVTGAISGASINTGGLGNFLIGQNLRTTDSPTFAGVNTGFGANEVFKTSTQSIEAYGITSQLSAMDIGEVRYVFYRCNADSEPAYLKTPAGGNFYISPVAGSDYPTGGSWAGNTNFAVFGGNLATGVFIIRRNS